MSARSPQPDFTEEKNSSIILLSFLRHFVGAAIFCAVLSGFHFSGNPLLNNCAAAFGRALRYDCQWQTSAADAINNIKSFISSDNDDSSHPSAKGGADAITFQ